MFKKWWRTLKESIEDSDNCLSKLNNFYENILSASYIEGELLALIGRSLREEINKYILSFFTYISYNIHIKLYLIGRYFEDDFFIPLNITILKNYNILK